MHPLPLACQVKLLIFRDASLSFSHLEGRYLTAIHYVIQ